MDGLDHRVATHGVDAVIEVAVQNANLVIHDHGTVAATDEVVDSSGGIAFAGQCTILENGSNIVVPINRLRLPSGKMTVDET